jgi:hypothetical protein
MAGFHRIDTSKLQRGAARLLYAPTTQAKPAKLADVINLTGTGAVADVQTVTISGTPTGGTFTLTFNGSTTGPIAYNAVASAVQTAFTQLPSVGTGNATAAGGPLPGAPVTITFAGTLSTGVQNDITAASSLTGGTTPAVTVTHTTPGVGQYDALSGWRDLGATREGIQIAVNNTEDAYDVDQVAGAIGTAPNTWTCTVTTNLAEVTFEHLVLAWEGVPITTDATALERETAFAGATSYTERRLAVLFQRPSTKLVGFFFHRAVRAPQEGTLNFVKGGDAQTIQVQFNILADATEADPRAAFFRVREQI